jgi:hypothetical protein
MDRRPSSRSALFPLSRAGLIAALALLALGGCATLGNAPGDAPLLAPAHMRGAAPGAGASAGTAKAPDGAPLAPLPPGAPPHFATVIKDAKKTEGLFTLWQKDDKVWLALKPEDFDKPFFLSPKFETGIGEAGLYGGLMARSWGASYGKPQIVEFRRIYNQVQMIALNTAFTAPDGSPQARAVAAAFSPSLLGSSPVLSQPDPDSKAVLIDANGLFVGDMLGVSMLLQRAYHQSYGFDPRHSAITELRGNEREVVFEVMNHFATGAITPGVAVPLSLPDARSLFVTVNYSLAALPEHPMQPRRADPRIGYFTTTVNDFSDDLARSPRVRYLNRWRLEKKDPNAALSEPVKPITFWLDRTIPEKYRGAIRDGILEWNKAFERIGFKNAIVVQVQPDDAKFDTLDFGHAAVRWMTNSSPSFGAIGPTHVDPRTGEILDADIGIESLSSRAIRSLRAQVIGGSAAASAGSAKGNTSAWPGLRDPDRPSSTQAQLDPDACNYAAGAAEQLSYALDVLEARGDLAPDSPEADAFVRAYLKDTTMHEVGHVLGLRHNFRASTAYTDAQLDDPEFTRRHGNTGSVMEYAPINLPAPGHRGGTPFMTTLGPYDYWAIEYAYKPAPPGATPAQQQAMLDKIAARSNEPQLAYGTDEDNFLGVDPDVLQFDLGSDVMAFAKKRIAIAHDLLARQESRPLDPNEDYSILRRTVSYALRDVSRAAGALTRQIGGVRTLRDFPGSGRDPLSPVPAAKQRAALELLAGSLLSSDSFRISPALARKLAPDFQERTDAVFEGDPSASVETDFSFDDQVVSLQQSVLDQLMSDTVMTRIIDSEAKFQPGQAFHVSELFDRLDTAVWSELKARRGDIAPTRRELQRDYVNRLAELLLKPSALERSDARSLLRVQARSLLERVRASSRRPGLSEEARAHLADCADTLSQALDARLMRAGL